MECITYYGKLRETSIKMRQTKGVWKELLDFLTINRIPVIIYIVGSYNFSPEKKTSQRKICTRKDTILSSKVYMEKIIKTLF